MVLEFLFYNQAHKTRSGYYINHDNLILATREERSRLITYFIANQVPEKLDPEDRVAFNKAMESEVSSKAVLIGSISALFGLTGFPYFATRINKRPILNIAASLVVCPVLYFIGNQLTQTVFEPKFVANNAVLTELSNKYKFTVFDFAQAKKESHLKSLRRELISDSVLINPGL